ncbi:MAG: 50S ribosomal protein L25/general stress protein Ctc [Pseudomonadales bacterium]|nr:50S ribosomal protein L25/general stress protein Ctc [Pseudomonadales bacterium]
MSEFTLNAQARTDTGKGASRRLRRNAGLVPAIVYGGNEPPKNITLAHKDVMKSLENEAVYSHILDLNIDNESENVILKAVQRHPAKNQIIHLDFMRVVKGTKITLRVPLHFINQETCIGVKQQGGVISHNMTDLEIICLPRNIPEFIEVDMKDVELDSTVHISDLKLPEGVESVDLSHGEDHDLPVANVHKIKGTKADDEDGASSEEGTDEE